jgi:hypothetical protein
MLASAVYPPPSRTPVEPKPVGQRLAQAPGTVVGKVLSVGREDRIRSLQQTVRD